MKRTEKTMLISLLNRAQAICAKHGMELGNGGDIASMLGGIVAEIETGAARENEFLVEAQ